MNVVWFHQFEIAVKALRQIHALKEDNVTIALKIAKKALDDIGDTARAARVGHNPHAKRLKKR